jgi:hypothetical protein
MELALGSKNPPSAVRRSRAFDGWLPAACAALATNKGGNLDHRNTLRLRGFLMNAQLILIAASALGFLAVVINQIR